MRLASLVRGSGPSVTFLHGFTQTKESWLPVVDSLHVAIEATVLDAPGHGESSVQGRTLAQSADDIAESMKPGILVGYSMGARMALHTALLHPQLVQALVLVSGTPGLREPAERSARIEADEKLANRIEEIGITQFIPEWLSNPMFRGLTAEFADAKRRCMNSEKGLADSLRYAGTGTQEPLWNQLQTLNIPVLLITGAHDEKFTEIARQMASEIPNCEHRIMAEVGHTCHLEDIQSFVDIFENWYSGLQGEE